MRLPFIIAFCITSIVLYAQDGNIKKEREDFTLKLAVDGKTIYESDIKASAYLNGPNVLQLYPGEKVFIETEQANGVISSMQVVKENKNPNKTIAISFTQNVDGEKHKGMLLEIDNPFKMALKYSCKMFLMNQKKWVETDVLPVKANLTSFETWSDIVVTIALDNWKLSKE